MRIVVLTGLSGSGKTVALRALEDAGYYAIDNLPIRLLDGLISLFDGGGSADTELLALVVDARTAMLSSRSRTPAPADEPDPNLEAARAEVELIPPMLEATRNGGHSVQMVFFDTRTEVLERRYSETRRRHPLSSDGSILSGIEAERRLLQPLRQVAQTALDTSEMSVHDLRRAVQHAFDARTASDRNLAVSVVSFGFKYGLPPDADLVFDVRFLPNPYFIPELKHLSGCDASVAEYVWGLEETKGFLQHLYPLLDFLLPQYREEGKAHLTLALGCTGGRHRSVALARRVSDWVSERGFRVSVRHRDVDR